MSDSFFTAESFQTLAGCVASVVVIVSTTRHVFNWGPRWFGLCIALIVSIAAYKLTNSGTPFDASTLMIIVLNSCLIYTSAFGIQNTVIVPVSDSNENSPQENGPPGGDSGRKTFTTIW